MVFLEAKSKQALVYSYLKVESSFCVQESMRYDQLRDLVAKRNPGWEYLQDVR